jgi:bifunctional non-homologous end joining protein LigD
MLCLTGDLSDLKRKGYGGEEKFDGTCLVIIKKKDSITLQNRDGIIYTRRIPEAVESARRIPGTFTLHTEAVYINPRTGQTEFTPCQRRCATEDLVKQIHLQQIERIYPLTCKAHDILEFDGKDLKTWPYTERKALLQRLLSKVKTTIEYVPYRTDLGPFFEEVKQQEGEGIVAKRLDSPYQEMPDQNRRSWDWLKIKNWRYEEFNVAGFTEGKNSRKWFFGALIVTDDQGRYRGKVGGGFSDVQLRLIKDILTDAPRVARPFTLDESYTAVKTKLRIRARYYKITENGVMRFPEFEDIISS